MAHCKQAYPRNGIDDISSERERKGVRETEEIALSLYLWFICAFVACFICARNFTFRIIHISICFFLFSFRNFGRFQFCHANCCLVVGCSNCGLVRKSPSCAAHICQPVVNVCRLRDANAHTHVTEVVVAGSVFSFAMSMQF